jgi:PKD repeat protein
VTGQTASVKFSSRPGILQTGGTSGDVFVVKLGPEGDSVLYVAVIGGQEYDVGHAIAVDQNGNAYVTGETFSEGFPVTDAAFDRSYNGVGDAFVLKLSQSGDSLAYSTFLGGRHDDAGYGIAVDGNGQAHVTGRTWSGNFHTTGGAFRTAPAGDADAFLTKIADTGDYLVYSTYLGGLGSDSGVAVALDPEGNAIVTGTCMPAGFPVTDGAMNSSGAGTDVFATKFGKNGNAPIFSAVLGGTGSDSATGIVIDPAGIVHIAGNTDSADFPGLANSSSSAPRGGKDIFIAGLNSSGGMVHSACLGGSGDDTASGISTDPDGRLFITGMTASKDFPITSGALATALKGGSDAFISMLNSTWSGFEYSTYLGGSLDDAGLGISVSMTGCPIVAGVTASQDFRMVPGAPWPVHSGGNDGFLAKMDIIAPIAVAGGDITANESTVVQFNGSASTDNEAIASYSWNLIDGVANITLNGPAPGYIFIKPGKYNVTLEVRDKVGNSAIDKLTVTILEYPYPIARAGSDMAADIGAPVVLNGTASTDNGAIIRYAWSFHDGLNNASVEGREPAWVFRVPGNYTVVLEVTDDDGNTDSDMFNITVKDVSEPVARPGEFITVSRGSAAYLDGSASTDNAGIANFTWSFMHNGTAVSISGANSSFVFWEPGEHEVVLTVTDAAGNTDSNIILVTVQDSGDSGNMLGPFMLIASLLFLCLAVIRSRKKRGRNSGKEGGGGD